MSFTEQNIAMCERLPEAVAAVYPDEFAGKLPTLRELMDLGDAAVAYNFLACDYLPADGNPRFFNFYEDASKIEDLPGALPLTGDVAGHPLAFTYDDDVPGPLVFLNVNGTQFAARASGFADDVTEDDLLRALAILLG